MANLFSTTLNIFLWKHFKCLKFSWIKNILIIIVPILLCYGQIYVFNAVTNNETTTFNTVSKVKKSSIAQPTLNEFCNFLLYF